MPTEEQIAEINDPSKTNTLGVITDPTTSTYYKATGQNTIRCPEGYVFHGSNVFSPNGEDLSILEYTLDGNHWKNSDGTQSNQELSSITCVKKFCDPQGIVNSDKEFHVLVQDPENLDNYQDIICNDGYIFDTTNTKMGRVKCDIIPIMENEEFSQENKVAWMVYNPTAENKCALNTTKDACELEEIPYIISTEPNEIYSNEKSLKCTWIPELNDESNSGFKRDNGQCKYIHRADLNNSEPICKSMYCSNKSVPNSNRVEGVIGPLPGPETGNIHGNCVNFDGQIIDNITNSSDCACFQHKSCNTCTSETNGNNCQWCGYDENGNGGFCYSSKTYLDICNVSVRNDRGGSCQHVKNNKPKSGEPSDGWDRIGCENNVCVKKQYWDNTISTLLNEDQDRITENYNRNAISESECIADNNEWDDGIHHHTSDTCILKNKKIKGTYTVLSDLKYYPIRDGATLDNYKINISDKICVPDVPDGDFNQQKIIECDDKNENECSVAVDCKWIDNDLRDSIFNWNSNKSIKFKDGPCPIKNITGSNITVDGQYIILNDYTNTDITDNTYLASCPIENLIEESNIFDNSYCERSNFLLNPTPNKCEEPNIKYCSSSDKIDGQSVCQGHTSSKLGNIDGCLYYDTVEHAQSDGFDSNYKCYGSQVTPRCYPEETDPYNCDKSYNLPANNTDSDTENNRNDCLNTLYTPIGDIVPMDEKIYKTYNEEIGDNNFKKYLKCETKITQGDNSEQVGDEETLENRCNMIGQDNAHWGILCNGTTNNKYPGKHICEYSEGSTWGKYSYTHTDGSNKFEYGCFKNDGSKYEDDELCGLMNGVTGEDFITDSKVINLIISAESDTDSIVIGSPVTDITSSDSTVTGTVVDVTPSATTGTSIMIRLNEPIQSDIQSDIQSVTINSNTYSNITNNSFHLTPDKNSLNESKKYCIIDRYGFTNSTDDDYLNTCISYENHSIGYQFIEKELKDEEGACINVNSGNVVPNLDHRNCEDNNKIYVQEYNYNNLGTCDSIGSARSIDNPDIPTEWTGGEISNDGDIHVSDCSPSIMNTCNVDCDQGYGGGGEYICHYNRGGHEICNLVNSKSQISDQNVNIEDLCNTYPSCEYDASTSTCSYIADKPHQGHLEWIGTPCYKIDNTAFSHGIAKLPELDKFIPPFIRVVIYMSIYTIIAVLIIILLVKFGLKLIGGSIDFSINTSFNSVNKIIDVITDSDKVVRKIILSEGVKKEHKAGYMIFTVGVFIGSYYLFQYIKDYIKDSWTDIKNYIHRLRYSSFKMPSQISQAIGTAEEEVGAAAGQITGDDDAAAAAADANRLKAKLSELDLHTNIEFDNLTTIIQTLTGGIVIFIIIVLVAKSDLIGKVAQKTE